MRTMVPGKALRQAILAAGGLFLSCSYWLIGAGAAEDPKFVVRPYIQLGNNPTYGKTDNMELLWTSKADKAAWNVEVQKDGKKWVSAQPVQHREIAQSGGTADYIFTSSLKELPVGKTFVYRVLCDGKPVFEASAQTRKDKKLPYRFSVFGDMGAGTDGQRQIANQCYRSKPDFVVLPGDIVYYAGLYSQYLNNYFPVYNADSPSERGVPLLRSVLTIGVLGNHDIATNAFFGPTNFDITPDALAYFYLFSQPLNGPSKLNTVGTPPLAGAVEKQEKFKAAAGETFPVMGNFSFDYGNSHWLVLDGNHYTSWTNPELRKWVQDDLQKAKKATWRFVTFHQPGFSTDTQHAHEQRMRLLSDLFEANNVDLVFSGHAHDYQRTFPLKFQPKLKFGQPFINPDGTVDGTIIKDKEFDGVKVTKPKGIIYIVTGAGGAKLYKSIPGALDGTKLDFTDKFDGAHFSLSECEVNDRTFVMKQVAADGQILDTFTLTK